MASLCDKPERSGLAHVTYGIILCNTWKCMGSDRRGYKSLKKGYKYSYLTSREPPSTVKQSRPKNSPRTWAKLPEAHLFYFAMTCVSPGTSKSEDKTNGQLESHARRTLYAPYIPFKGPSPEYSSLTEPCKDPLKGSQNGRTPFDASPGAGRTGARLFA